MIGSLKLTHFQLNGCYFNVNRGSFVLARGFIENKDYRVVPAHPLTHRVIPQNAKSGFLLTVSSVIPNKLF